MRDSEFLMRLAVATEAYLMIRRLVEQQLMQSVSEIKREKLREIFSYV